jgi:hypothetical protein
MEPKDGGRKRGGDGGTMAKGQATAPQPKVTIEPIDPQTVEPFTRDLAQRLNQAHANARYTINLQRAFGDLVPELQRAYGQPAGNAAEMLLQDVIALLAVARFLEQMGPDYLVPYAARFTELAGALEGRSRGVRSPILEPASVKRSDPPMVWIARAHVASAIEIVRPVLKGREAAAAAKWAAKKQGREAAAEWAAKKHPSLKKLITESGAHPKRGKSLEKAIISWCKDFSSGRVTDKVAARAYSKALDNWKTCASNYNSDQIKGEADKLLREALTLNDESLKSVDLASGGS